MPFIMSFFHLSVFSLFPCITSCCCWTVFACMLWQMGQLIKHSLVSNIGDYWAIPSTPNTNIILTLLMLCQETAHSVTLCSVASEKTSRWWRQTLTLWWFTYQLAAAAAAARHTTGQHHRMFHCQCANRRGKPICWVGAIVACLEDNVELMHLKIATSKNPDMVDRA